MIWPFTHKARRVSPEVRAADAASTRALEVIRQVDDRETEVNQYYRRLNARKRANNFGPALMVAMERRGLDHANH